MRIPSKSQQQAIAHLSGPAMVIAGPGSGKTFTIVKRILNLICHYHVSPENILVITYTKAAASEMKERFEKEYVSALQAGQADGRSIGSKAQAAVNFGTFHSICYHILKQSGIVKENSLIKESDKRKLMQVILGTMGLGSKSGYDEVTELISEISKRKNLSCLHDTSGEKMKSGGTDSAYSVGSGQSVRFSEEELAAVFGEYGRHLREQGLIDFDDMILRCLELLTSDKKSLDRYRKLFGYLLVDEFQDINPPQYEILKLLAHPGDNLFVVGDDDQAIYGFRGATPGIMQQFAGDFDQAKQIMLTENYRCGADIVRLAGAMIAQNKERFSKEFYPVRPEGRVIFNCFDSHREEEKGIVKKLSALTEEELSETAIILRTNREAALYAGYLKEARIAVKGSGNAGTDRKGDIYHGFIMQDVLAFLSYLYEGNRRSDFISFMNKPNRFLTRMALPEETVRIKALEQYYLKNREMLEKIRTLFRQLEIAEGLSPYLAVSFFRKTLGYNEYLRSRAGDGREYQSLLGLADKVQQCFFECKKGMSVREFAQKASEEEDHAAEGGQESGVRILTMHGSKGLEFERVFLPDLNEGVIPGRESQTPEALEEERRLLYVAVTRAKRELYLYCSRERGRKPSRYLEGLAYSRESSSTSSSNSALSRNSSKASETISYSSSSSI